VFVKRPVERNPAGSAAEQLYQVYRSVPLPAYAGAWLANSPSNLASRDNLEVMHRQLLVVLNLGRIVTYVCDPSLPFRNIRRISGVGGEPDMTRISRSRRT
jgi:hypothetical protein